MVQVVVPISASTADALLLHAEAAKAEGADLVEVRFDTCARRGAPLDDLLAVLPRLALPAIATARHASEGGDWDGSEGERLALLAKADRAGAAFVDIELARFTDALRPTVAQLILSHHDFTGMGGDLPAVVRRMHAARAAIAKIAVTPADAHDLAPIEALYHGAPLPLVALGMGEHGLPSRLLAGAWGAAMTFGRLADSPGSAPGQPLARDLVDLYRVRSQGPHTRIHGVIGSPIAHSLSPLIHNAAFAHHQVDAVYVPFLVDDAPRFWAACGGWIDGLSITIPHKHALLTAVDELEPLAKRIGAINTIWRDEQHRAIGANTDASAATDCIEAQAGDLSGRRVTILGAGGVSRAIAFAVAERGAEVTIANRGLERAQELATEVGATPIELDGAPAVDYDVLVNGTAVGMGNDRESPWPEDAHRAGAIVFDTVYTPLETKLIKQAQLAGAITICGLSMFIGQALGQYKRWIGKDAPEALMYRLALERLGSVLPDPLGAAPQGRKSTAALEQSLGGALPPG